MNVLEIPNKQYFRIGEVARILRVRPSVLRYWETEFHQIRPEKSRTNQRLYSRRQVEKLLHIRHLLYEEKYTISGARKKLQVRPQPAAGSVAVGDGNLRQLLSLCKKEAEDLLRLVSE